MSIFKHDCKIHGHRFEARYSQEENRSVSNMINRLEEFMPSTLRTLLLNATISKYDYDICTKCGKIIKNKE